MSTEGNFIRVLDPRQVRLVLREAIKVVLEVDMEECRHTVVALKTKVIVLVDLVKVLPTKSTHLTTHMNPLIRRNRVNLMLVSRKVATGEVKIRLTFLPIQEDLTTLHRPAPNL